MSRSWALFVSFAKIGSFTFGGGFAMIPLIQREIIHKRGWVDADEFLELLTLAQSAPGPIALNTSVFVGYRVDGYRGAICSTLGVALPSFFAILLVAIYFSSIRNNPTVEAIFKGMRPAVVALILAPMYNLSKGMGWWRSMWAVAAALCLWWFGFSPIYLILVGAGAGLLYGFIRNDGPKNDPQS